jgi:dTDP-4-dehydrorhamnose 3,5-epimerase
MRSPTHCQPPGAWPPAVFPEVGDRLPHGVERRVLAAHTDERGSFTEILRRSWCPETEYLQWNLVHSQAGVLRGVHLHPRHDDYLVVVAGEVVVGLRDLRRQSPTAGVGTMLSMRGDRPEAVFIPHGVAHGFCFLTESTYICGVSHYWDTDDELGCRYDDLRLNLSWPVREPLLSARDKDAENLVTLLATIADLC